MNETIAEYIPAKPRNEQHGLLIHPKEKPESGMIIIGFQQSLTKLNSGFVEKAGQGHEQMRE